MFRKQFKLAPCMFRLTKCLGIDPCRLEGDEENAWKLIRHNPSKLHTPAGGYVAPVTNRRGVQHSEFQAPPCVDTNVLEERHE